VLGGIPIALTLAIDRTRRFARIPNNPGVVLTDVDFVRGGIITEQCNASLKRDSRIGFALVSAFVFCRIVVRTSGAACILERIGFRIARIQIILRGILAQGGDAVRKNLVRVLSTLVVATQRAGCPATIAEGASVGLAHIFIFFRRVGRKRGHAIREELVGIHGALIVAVHGAPCRASVSKRVCLVFAHVYFVVGRILPKARHALIENDPRFLLTLVPAFIAVVGIVGTPGAAGVAKGAGLILACVSIGISSVRGKIGQAVLKQNDRIFLTLGVACRVSIGQWCHAEPQHCAQ